MNRSSKCQLGAGFTLAEVLVVLVIIGIAAAIVIPMVGDTSEMQARSAARQLVSTILFAQTAAISTQQQYQIVFDAAANSYEVQDKDGVVITDPAAAGKPYRVSHNDNPRLNAVTIDSADFDGTNQVWFDRLGAPYRGAIGDNVPLNSGNVVISAGGHSMTVNVSPVTGRVKIN